MALSRRTICLIFACLAITGRLGLFITTPLWLDYYHHDNSTNSTASWQSNQSDPPTNTTSPNTTSASFVLISQWGVVTMICGVAAVWVWICTPHSLKDAGPLGEIPVRDYVVMGVSQGVSSLMFNYSVSGARTAPYLQAVLANCGIPLQFLIRFVILRRRPTLLKLICACAVAVSELACLLPSIFPSLESAHAHREEGGATGAGAILWPLCFVGAMVPFSVANSVMERSVQGGPSGAATQRPASSQLVYFLLRFNLGVFITVLLLFWVDLVPGFGTSNSIREFGETMWFDLQCLVGAAGCDLTVTLLGWSNYLAATLASISFVGLMRYSEGANFVVIVLSLRTPIVFLFWTLFQEQPLHWSPHAHTSTWISVGAICVMVPAIVLYELAPSEKAKATTSNTEEQRLLGEDAGARGVGDHPVIN